MPDNRGLRAQFIEDPTHFLMSVSLYLTNSFVFLAFMAANERGLLDTRNENDRSIGWPHWAPYFYAAFLTALFGEAAIRPTAWWVRKAYRQHFAPNRPLIYPDRMTLWLNQGQMTTFSVPKYSLAALVRTFLSGGFLLILDEIFSQLMSEHASELRAVGLTYAKSVGPAVKVALMGIAFQVFIHLVYQWVCLYFSGRGERKGSHDPFRHFLAKFFSSPARQTGLMLGKIAIRIGMAACYNLSKVPLYAGDSRFYFSGLEEMGDGTFGKKWAVFAASVGASATVFSLCKYALGLLHNNATRGEITRQKLEDAYNITAWFRAQVEEEAERLANDQDALYSTYDPVDGSSAPRGRSSSNRTAVINGTNSEDDDFTPVSGPPPSERGVRAPKTPSLRSSRSSASVVPNPVSPFPSSSTPLWYAVDALPSELTGELPQAVIQSLNMISEREFNSSYLPYGSLVSKFYQYVYVPFTLRENSTQPGFSDYVIRVPSADKICFMGNTQGKFIQSLQTENNAFAILLGNDIPKHNSVPDFEGFRSVWQTVNTFIPAFLLRGKQDCSDEDFRGGISGQDLTWFNQTYQEKNLTKLSLPGNKFSLPLWNMPYFYYFVETQYVIYCFIDVFCFNVDETLKEKFIAAYKALSADLNTKNKWFALVSTYPLLGHEDYMSLKLDRVSQTAKRYRQNNEIRDLSRFFYENNLIFHVYLGGHYQVSAFFWAELNAAGGQKLPEHLGRWYLVRQDARDMSLNEVYPNQSLLAVAGGGSELQTDAWSGIPNTIGYCIASMGNEDATVGYYTLQASQTRLIIQSNLCSQGQSSNIHESFHLRKTRDVISGSRGGSLRVGGTESVYSSQWARSFVEPDGSVQLSTKGSSHSFQVEGEINVHPDFEKKYGKISIKKTLVSENSFATVVYCLSIPSDANREEKIAFSGAAHVLNQKNSENQNTLLNLLAGVREIGVLGQEKNQAPFFILPADLGEEDITQFINITYEEDNKLQERLFHQKKHDHISSSSRQLPLWNMPYRFYLIETTWCVFFMIDAYTYNTDRAQQLWLKQTHTAYKSKNTKKWFVMVSCQDLSHNISRKFSFHLYIHISNQSFIQKLEGQSSSLLTGFTSQVGTLQCKMNTPLSVSCPPNALGLLKVNENGRELEVCLHEHTEIGKFIRI